MGEFGVAHACRRPGDPAPALLDVPGRWAGSRERSDHEDVRAVGAHRRVEVSKAGVFADDDRALTPGTRERSTVVDVATALDSVRRLEEHHVRPRVERMPRAA